MLRVLRREVTQKYQSLLFLNLFSLIFRTLRRINMPGNSFLLFQFMSVHNALYCSLKKF